MYKSENESLYNLENFHFRSVKFEIFLICKLSNLESFDFQI